MIFYRPTGIAEIAALAPIKTYESVFVPGAEVAWADYELLRHDFPFLRGVAEREIDAWICREFSFISREQAQLNDLRNTPIPTSDRSATVYRHVNYRNGSQEAQGRGDIMVVHDLEGKPAGLIDRKGSGVTPRKLAENHELRERFLSEGQTEADYQRKSVSNGLMLLGEAFIEASVMKVTQAVFDILNAEESPDLPLLSNGQRLPLQTIGGYFVLRLPFDVLCGNEAPVPAAIYTRQAHCGRIWGGKIYTPFVNIKQSDFFLALCDAGTVRIRLPELRETAKMIRGGRTFTTYEMGMDIARDYMDGNRNALTERIATVMQPARARWERAQARLIKKAQQVTDAGSDSRTSLLNYGAKDCNTGPLALNRALTLVVSTITAEPKRFARYAETFWWIFRRSPELVQDNPRIEKFVLEMISLPATELDADESGYSLRRWGLLLLPLLRESVRCELLVQELQNALVDQTMLGKGLWLMPHAELFKVWNKIPPRTKQKMHQELEIRLNETDLTPDPRRPQWRELLHALEAETGEENWLRPLGKFAGENPDPERIARGDTQF